MRKLNYFLVTTISLLGLFWGLVLKTEAAPQGRAVLLYDAQPKNYDYKVEPPYYNCPQCSGNADIREPDKGKTFPNNSHPWGWEVYVCDSQGGTITSEPRDLPLDFYTKRSLDICIPRATEDDQGRKRWPRGVAPNSQNMDCFAVQHLVDAPHQSEDSRTLNGTGLPNSQIDICTRELNQPGPNPYLDLTEKFAYNPLMCQGGDAVVLAGRQDPLDSECWNLNTHDVFANPFNYTESQLSCFLYFDDMAKVTVCKGADCASKWLSNSVNGIYPAPQPSESLCNLFRWGQGEYQVNIKVYDAGTQVYGTGDLWLTWRAHPSPTPTPTPTLPPGVTPTPTPTPTLVLTPTPAPTPPLIGSISGYVWIDTDAVCPVGGSKFADRVFAVRLNPGDIYAGTGRNGYYEFGPLAYGPYNVTVSRPAGWSCACAGGIPGQCIGTVTVSPDDPGTPQDEENPTIDFSIFHSPPGWLQVKNGDVYASTVTVSVPAFPDPAFERWFLDAVPDDSGGGVVISSGGLDCGGRTSQRGWEIQNYSDISWPNVLEAINRDSGIVDYENSFSINSDAEAAAFAGKILVAEGDIVIGGEVTQINAVLIAKNQIIINGSGNNKVLTIKGAMYAKNGFGLLKTLNDNKKPAIVVEYEPAYLLQTTSDLGSPRISWRER